LRHARALYSLQSASAHREQKHSSTTKLKQLIYTGSHIDLAPMMRAAIDDF
jgi:hypothetical protein